MLLSLRASPFLLTLTGQFLNENSVMATKNIAWNTGTGSITLTYSGQGDDTVVVSSSANNLYQDRSQTVTFSTTDGSSISRQVTVTQKAKEPNFKTSEGYWFVTYDDKYFTVQE